MTTKHFSRNAEKLLRRIGKDEKFRITPYQCCRSDFNCPLAAIYNRYFADGGYKAYNTNFVSLSGFTEDQLLRFKKMGLSPKTVMKITDAADSPTSLYRDRLLFLLGVEV